MRVIDLTLPLEHGMRGVEFETKYTVADQGWNARTLHLYSHAGTHMDAPVHFEASPQTIDQIPLERCLGRAWIAPLESIAPRTPITPDHLGDLVHRIEPGDALLLRTGWSQHVDNPDHYRNEFPPISPQLGQWLVGHGVRLVGVEPPSVGDVNDLPAVTEIHKILLGGDVIIVEGLTNLEQIPGESCFFAAVPLRVAGSDGSPCRAFAIEGLAEFTTNGDAA